MGHHDAQVYPKSVTTVSITAGFTGTHTQVNYSSSTAFVCVNIDVGIVPLSWLGEGKVLSKLVLGVQVSLCPVHVH